MTAFNKHPINAIKDAVLKLVILLLLGYSFAYRVISIYQYFLSVFLSQINDRLSLLFLLHFF